MAPAGKDAAAPSSPSSSAASSSSSSPSPSRQHQQKKKKGVHFRSRSHSLWNPRRGHGGHSHDDLALPLGMSFAAILSQILDTKNGAGKKIPVDHIFMICTSAIKESVTNIYGDTFDCFLINFEKSFGSTLRTLQLINETSSAGQENRPVLQVLTDEQGSKTTNKTSPDERRDISSCSVSYSCQAAAGTMEELQENQQLNSLDNQLVLHGQINQHLARVSHSIAGPGYTQNVLNTFEKSVREQTRYNDLKAVEIGLVMRKLQLKQSQLALNSYANLLEKIKISMGVSKAFFKEEKLRNQMQDTRHAELLKTCIDLLVTGIIMMSAFLTYGAYIYSYQRISEATSACTTTTKEPTSWWIPKPVASFSSGWQLLRCHVVVLTRMSFGLLMILAVAYSVFQRSAMAGSAMPVTFILLLLGFACGVAGKLCVDTLGGSGYHWLLYWEALCILHFVANVFPSVLYPILYGPISVSQAGTEVVRVPYWIRRYTFYSILLMILPVMSGLLPFASLGDWKEHFTEKVYAWGSVFEIED